MLQRHFSAFLLVVYSLFSLTCLSWSADSFVRTLKHTFFYLVSPATLPVLSQMDRWGDFGQNMARLLRLDQSHRDLEARWRQHRLDDKRFRAVERENERLTALLGLRPRPAHEILVGRVWAYDANDRFHSIFIRRGRRDGVRVADPVIAFQDGREVLVGQVTDVFNETCRVLLLTDPLSAVSAAIPRTGEQGSVEGQGSARLVLNYLFPDSDVRVGDEVVTAGLGGIFPEGMAVGYVESVEADPETRFKKAFLRPAGRFNNLTEVCLLRRSSPSP